MQIIHSNLFMIQHLLYSSNCFFFVIILILFFLPHLFIVALTFFLLLLSFHKRLLRLQLNFCSLLDVYYHLWDHEPNESTELSFLIQTVSALQTVLYPRTNFLQSLSMHREPQLISKLVNVRTYVIQSCPSFSVRRKCLCMFEVLLLGLVIVVFVLCKAIEKGLEVFLLEL